MQNMWISVVLIVLIIIVGLIAGTRLSTPGPQRRAVYSAFGALGVLAIWFFVFIALFPADWIVPFFTVACIVIPICIYMGVARSAHHERSASPSKRSFEIPKKDVSAEAAKQAVATAPARPAAAQDTAATKPKPAAAPAKAPAASTSPSSAPSATSSTAKTAPSAQPAKKASAKASAAAEKTAQQQAPKPAAKPASKPTEKPAEKPTKAAAPKPIKQAQPEPQPMPQPASQPEPVVAFASIHEEKLVPKEAEAPQHAAPESPEAIEAPRASEASQVTETTKALEVPEAPKAPEPKPEPKPEPEPQKAEGSKISDAADIDILVNKAVAEEIDELEELVHPFSAPSAASSAEADQGPDLNLGAPVKSTSTKDEPASSDVAPAAGTTEVEPTKKPAPAPKPKPKPAKKLTPAEQFAEFCTRAAALRDQGAYAIAAMIYEEAATFAPSASDARNTQFDELACYVKAGDTQKAKALAAKLRQSSVLTRFERIKLDAVERMS